MNNQLGLEALAALASAAPTPAPSQRSSGEATQTSEAGGSQSSVSAAGGTSTGGSDSKSSVQHTSHPPMNGGQVLPNASTAQMSSQIQQLMSTLQASGGGGGGAANPNIMGSNQGLSSILSGLPASGQTQDNSSLMTAMQNAAQYNLLAQAQAQAQAANQQNHLSALSNLALQLSRGSHPQAPGLGLGLPNPLASFLDDANQRQRANNVTATTLTKNYEANNPSAPGVSSSTAAFIAPQPRTSSSNHHHMDSHHRGYDSEGEASEGMMMKGGEKREQKRAANRRSAQLSRKRKKLFIEELKEENDDLRRKEQILMSLPDLVVVFDSSGKLGFVSHSVARLLSFSATELEGTSFWDRLCEDSVRLLKAAFMDSLATREAGSDTAPLGAGVWELRLVDKDNSQKLVALNGVVHFAGDRPECVCTIRPRDKDRASITQDKNAKTSGLPAVSIDTRQSAMGNAPAGKKAKVGKSRDLIRISDSGSGTPESADSESGSCDD